jgi:hypothetical protein
MEKGRFSQLLWDAATYVVRHRATLAGAARHVTVMMHGEP